MPATIELQIEIVGHVQLRRALAGRMAALDDLRPFFQQLAADFYAFEAGVFAAEGAAEGLPGWAALDRKYQRWKVRRYPGARILVQTGRLRDALTKPDAPDSIHELSKDELRLGASLRTPGGKWNLGMLHQTGTGTMPARPPLRLSNKRKSAWMRLLRDYVRAEA